MSSGRRIVMMMGLTAVVLGGRAAADGLSRYRFGVNETASLPNWAFVVDRANRQPKRGDLLQFVAPPNRFYPAGSVFVKVVYGVAGDHVDRVEREFRVNGRPVAVAKAASQHGVPLAAGPVGVIPPGRYFVGTPSKDGFDSRYADIGWIGHDRVVGVVTATVL